MSNVVQREAGAEVWPSNPAQRHGSHGPSSRSQPPPPPSPSSSPFTSHFSDKRLPPAHLCGSAPPVLTPISCLSDYGSGDLRLAGMGTGDGREEEEEAGRDR
ncbi:unnamed protein product [Pleuronectes platessa]|uniref:Uncharacterized protein n=1 Tax=Pleuronectes platessa TaxID=8262 RepID=A0A9N7YQ51_PLEPL|nr:unnamed protein product [Pleuronectes platessa]